MLSDGHRVTLKPDGIASFVVGLAVSPLFAGGLWLLAGGPWPFLVGTSMVLGALYVWLSVFTARLCIEDGVLKMLRFGRVAWSIKVGDARLVSSGAKSAPMVPAFRVESSKSSETVGEIVRTQFHPRELDTLLEIVRAESK